MTPAIAFVVATGDARSPIALAIEALGRQTIASEIEVVVVRASADAPLPVPDASGRFGRFHVVDDLAAPSVDRALAAGVEATTAPLICLLEDHAFPLPDCAARLVDAFRGPWTIVGCAVESANVGPARLALATMYVGFGPWADPVVPGEQADLPNHNVAYSRALLVGRAELARLLDRGSPFHRTLAAEGARFYLSDARVRHINPSAPGRSLAVRFAAGRLYGADRVRRGSWSWSRRVGYALASPLIPLVRFRRLARDRFGDVERQRGLWPRLAPAVLLMLAADAAGQAVGYLGGSGAALQLLSDAERRRFPYVNKADRRAYFGQERNG